MLEDRIIVQDRGIDAGLAALMQNANKGMDPAALMAMMNNNGGFGGNGGWWWIWIILIWFCWGGNGFGGRNAGALASELNTDANTNLLMQAINGNKDAISNLSTTLNCDINAVQSALNQINAGVSQMPNQPRKKVVDVTIQCNGESRKFTIPENKSVITDTNLGLTISTDKQEIVNILRNQYNTYKARKESIAKCDEEMSKCQALLGKLDIPKEPTNTEDPRIKELQDEVNELKNIIKQASSMVPPPMKQMLPQNMQNVMKEVDQ